MLSQQETAWAVYVSLFILLSIALIFRCRSNLLLLPFTLFSVLSAVGLIALLTRHFVPSSSIVLWADRSVVINQLPLFSLLLFVGIVQMQIIFARHVAQAVRERHFSMSQKWTEYHRPRFQITPNRSRWVIWSSITILVLYTVIVIVFLCLRILQNDDNVTVYYRAMAICTTVLAALAITQTGIAWANSNLGSAKKIHQLRQSRSDALFLRLSPILFSVTLLGTCFQSWYFYTIMGGSGSIPIVGWISIETFLVYLPIMIILAMCLRIRRLHSIGQQYPVANVHTPAMATARDSEHSEQPYLPQVKHDAHQLAQHAASHVTVPTSTVHSHA